jgi:hypothetical protein
MWSRPEAAGKLTAEPRSQRHLMRSATPASEPQAVRRRIATSGTGTGRVYGRRLSARAGGVRPRRSAPNQEWLLTVICTARQQQRNPVAILAVLLRTPGSSRSTRIARPWLRALNKYFERNTAGPAPLGFARGTLDHQHSAVAARSLMAYLRRALKPAGLGSGQYGGRCLAAPGSWRRRRGLATRRS